MLITSLLFYSLALIFSLILMVLKTGRLLVLLCLTLGVLTYLVYVLYLTLKVGSFPFANLYGILSVLGNLLLLIFLVLELRGFGTLRYATLMSLFGILFSLLLLPAEPTPYKNVLYSLHVLSAILGYLFAFLGGINSTVRLLLERNLKAKKLYSASAPISFFFRWERISLNLAFVMFTLTLLFGSLWSRVHFGKHWIDDPKLLMTLMLWFYYAFVSHANLVGRPKPRTLSILIIVGAILSMLNLLVIRHEF